MVSAPGMTEVRHYPSPKLIRVGDVFMMQDDRYVKEEDAQNPIGTNVIQYTRPCIILSNSNRVLTVIPMTTKYHSFNCNYELRTSTEKQSFAILDQVTTIDFTRLTNRLGYLKLEVFMDLRDQYIKSISDQLIKGKAKRNVPFPRYDELDIVSFIHWGIYVERGKANAFLAVELINREFIALPINDYKSTSTLQINIHDFIFPISVDLTNVTFMGDEFYIGKEYDLIGYITDQTTVQYITRVLTSMYSFRVIRGQPLDQYPLLMYRTQRELFGILKPGTNFDTYVDILKFIRSIPVNQSIAKYVLRKDYAKELVIHFSQKLITPIVTSTYMYTDIVRACLENMNYLDIPLEELDFFNETFPDEFKHRVIEDYVPCISTKNPGFVFENQIKFRSIRPKYNSENAKYLANYILENGLEKINTRYT